MFGCVWVGGGVVGLVFVCEGCGMWAALYVLWLFGVIGFIVWPQVRVWWGSFDWVSWVEKFVLWVGGKLG